MINSSFKLGGRRNLCFKLQISSKGSACYAFGSSHVCLTPQLPFWAFLEAAPLPTLRHVSLEAERRKVFGAGVLYIDFKGGRWQLSLNW